METGPNQVLTAGSDLGYAGCGHDQPGDPSDLRAPYRDPPDQAHDRATRPGPRQEHPGLEGESARRSDDTEAIWGGASDVPSPGTSWTPRGEPGGVAACAASGAPRRASQAADGGDVRDRGRRSGKMVRGV